MCRHKFDGQVVVTMLNDDIAVNTTLVKYLFSPTCGDSWTCVDALCLSSVEEMCQNFPWGSAQGTPERKILTSLFPPLLVP